MRFILAGPAALLLAAWPAFAQAPAGPEFSIGSGTGNTGTPSVATDSAGNFIVAWVTAAGTSQPPSSVRVRLFDAGGAPRGGDIVIATHGTAIAYDTSVARQAGEGFVVVWDAFTTDGVGEIFGRRLSAEGTPLGAPFRVNSSTAPPSQPGPLVAAEAHGDFVVVWPTAGPPRTSRILARRFAADGSPRGGDFEIHPGGTGAQQYPALAGDADGNFIVTWTDGRVRVLGQRFSPAGTPVGAEFQVDTGASWSLAPWSAVALQSNGDFVVAWRNNGIDPPPLLARRFRADASPLGEEISVHKIKSDCIPCLARIALTTVPSGAFTIAWHGQGVDGDKGGIEARRYDGGGHPLGATFGVNARQADTQWSPALAADAAGNVVAIWRSESQVPGGGDPSGQRFGLLGHAALAVDTAAGEKSDGNGVLESGETVDLKPAWQNNTGLMRDLQGTLAALEGPEGPSYAIEDGAATYAAVPGGATRPCTDCYRIGVAGGRPARHWDAIASEVIGDGSDAHVRWTVHVGESFEDVPRTSPFYRSVEALLHRGVTAGCGGNAFCPDSLVTREQLAVPLLAAAEKLPQARQCLGPDRGFLDVPASSPFCDVIEEMRRRGITEGCGEGNFCPQAVVTREQLAVFLLRTLDPSLIPPACTTPRFSDVPAKSPFCRWIEELARRGMSAGCGGQRFCPDGAVTRAQMAYFLTGTFGLTLYGP